MPDFAFETKLHQLGYKAVAGCDEAGRGPLAGPVVAAAVILNPHFSLEGLDDSKKLTLNARHRLFDEIMREHQVSFCVIPPSVIDSMNILRASHFAMKQALLGLKTRPDYALIDGRDALHLPFASEAVIKGDGKIMSIAAASVIAKVTRDRLMGQLGGEYPHYGFAQHKGYGTPAHIAALKSHGMSEHHRRSFHVN